MERKPFSEPKLSKAEKSRKEKEKLLNSLGQNFGICWDAWQQQHVDLKNIPRVVRYDGKFDSKNGLLAFSEGAFFECAKKINPVYLEHLKEIIKQGVENIPKSISAPKLNKFKEVRSPEDIRQAEQGYFSGLAKDFMTRLEFFSRLKPPQELEIGNIKTGQEFIDKIEEKRCVISPDARRILNSEYFVKNLENKNLKINTVQVEVGDLFQDKKKHTIEDVYKKAKELTLKICLPEVGPQHRLQYPYEVQSPPQTLDVAMDLISDRPGQGAAFFLAGGQGIQPGLGLGEWVRGLDSEVGTRNKFLFSLS